MCVGVCCTSHSFSSLGGFDSTPRRIILYFFFSLIFRLPCYSRLFSRVNGELERVKPEIRKNKSQRPVSGKGSQFQIEKKGKIQKQPPEKEKESKLKLPKIIPKSSGSEGVAKKKRGRARFEKDLARLVEKEKKGGRHSQELGKVGRAGDRVRIVVSIYQEGEGIGSHTRVKHRYTRDTHSGSLLVR